MTVFLENPVTREKKTFQYVLDDDFYHDPDTGEELYYIIYIIDGFYIFNRSQWEVRTQGYSLPFPEFLPDYPFLRDKLFSFLKDEIFLEHFPDTFGFYLYSVLLSSDPDYFIAQKKFDRYVIEERYNSSTYEEVRSLACCRDVLSALIICRAMDIYRESESESNLYFYSFKKISADYVDYLDDPHYFDTEKSDDFDTYVSTDLPF